MTKEVWVVVHDSTLPLPGIESFSYKLSNTFKFWYIIEPEVAQKILGALLLVIFLVPGSFSVAKPRVENPIPISASKPIYVVQNGETFSDVVWRVFGSPLYGKSGWLAKIQLINPEIKDVNLIVPGQKIQFGENANRALASVNETRPHLTELPEKIKPSTSEVSLIDKIPSELPIEVVATDSTPVEVKAPPEASKELSELEPTSHLALKSGFEFFRLDSRDVENGGKSVLLSGLSPTVKLSWDLDWNKDWTNSIDLTGVRYQVLESSSSSTRTLNEASGSRYAFDLGSRRNWNESSRTLLKLGYEERIFSHAPSLAAVTIDRVGTPVINLGQERDVFRVRSAKLGFAMNLQALFPGTGIGYSTKFGYGGSVSSYLSHELKNFTLNGRLNMGYEQQNSTILEQARTELSILFGISWRFSN